ncbi:hypothetical protein [Mucilaginibacter agri]|uniref:Uncharacterized protein n=1 Tax=Mucilaginibacter agri TaxID=2695265 RepID=A0A965ZJN8_9SPHI|nr:hypothetical protein [Mucilaginibacter agri]NCD70881.1 hypothetical protein [Mucilaginibacter agri]
MVKRTACCFFALLFFASGVILPLGDFSLLRDIPQMYKNYTAVTSADEMGAIDFIGDYLLHGKEIFGNNKDDKIPASGNPVQFQHQASPLNVVFVQPTVTLLLVPEVVITHSQFYQSFYPSGYRRVLLRPPHS